MSLFLILLAAGNNKRFKSSTPKPYHLINKKTVLEHSLEAFKNIRKIKKIVIVYNSKHRKYLNNLPLKNILKIEGGKSRQESTFKALKVDSCLVFPPLIFSAFLIMILFRYFLCLPL